MIPEFLVFGLAVATACAVSVAVLAGAIAPSRPIDEHVSLGLLASGGGLMFYGPIGVAGILTNGGDAAWWEAGMMVPIGIVLIVWGARIAPEEVSEA